MFLPASCPSVFPMPLRAPHQLLFHFVFCSLLRSPRHASSSLSLWHCSATAPHVSNCMVRFILPVTIFAPRISSCQAATESSRAPAFLFFDSSDRGHYVQTFVVELCTCPVPPACCQHQLAMRFPSSHQHHSHRRVITICSPCFDQDFIRGLGNPVIFAFSITTKKQRQPEKKHIRQTSNCRATHLFIVIRQPPLMYFFNFDSCFLALCTGLLKLSRVGR